MGKIAFLFAGQGAQYPGMGKELYECSDAAKKVFNEAEALRPGILDLCFNGTKEELALTVNTQPCLFTVDLACAAALTELGIKADCAAGFSLGELAAVAFCGMLPFDQAFYLTSERARLMQECAEKNPGAMAAVLGLDAETVESICAEFGKAYPVNYNCPGQIVVSAAFGEIDALVARVTEHKGKAIKLAVSGAFHSPFMEDASRGLAAYMANLPFEKPQIPLYANSTAEPYTDDAAGLISKQLRSPVYWQKTIEHMQKDGVDTFVELGAGKTLSGFFKKIGGGSAVYNVEDRQSLEKTEAALSGGNDHA